MKYTITEIVIPRGVENEEIFSPQRIRLCIRDNGGGRYLSVEGINDEPETEVHNENAHEIYFLTVQEIDEFASICKNMLKGDYE